MLTPLLTPIPASLASCGLISGARQAGEWYDLALKGGGRKDGQRYSRYACYRRAVEINGEYWQAWYALGTLKVDSRQVNGKDYTRKECFQRALEIYGEDSFAWHWLGYVGGGRVNGKEYTAQQCEDMSEKFK